MWRILNFSIGEEPGGRRDQEKLHYAATISLLGRESSLGERISSNFVRDYLIVSSAVGQSRQCNLYGASFGCDNLLQLLAGEAFGILNGIIVGISAPLIQVGSTPNTSCSTYLSKLRNPYRAHHSHCNSGSNLRQDERLLC